MSARRRATIVAQNAAGAMRASVVVVIAVAVVAVVAPARPAAAQTVPNDRRAPILFCIDPQGNFAPCRTSTPAKSTPANRAPGTAPPSTAPSPRSPGLSTPSPSPRLPAAAHIPSAASTQGRATRTIVVAGGALLAVLLAVAIVLVIGRRRKARPQHASARGSAPPWEWSGPVAWPPPEAPPSEEATPPRSLGEHRILEASYRIKESPPTPTGDKA